MRPAVPVALVALAAAAAVAFGTDAQPTPAPTPPVREVVPREKFVKSVAIARREKARADRLERVLRHDPTVQEALVVASVAYGVPRADLSSVAWCESTNLPWARNGQYRGLFQFGPIFESSPYGRAGLSVWSPLASAMAAAYIVRHGGSGWSPWECGPRGAFRP